MAAAAPTLAVIRAQIRAIRKKSPQAKVFGILAPGRWTGPTIQGAGDDEIAVYQCDSPLQMRLALQGAPATASATVLVTPLDESKISDDIMMRLAMQRLHQINNWEIVRSLFSAKNLDPRITKHPCLSEMLLQCASTQDFQPVAGGLLDAETVWGILLEERLGLQGAHPDLVDILRCVADGGLAGRWTACPEEFRGAAADWLAESGGETTRTVLRHLDGEHGAKALATGLAMGVVYHDKVGHELDKAAGRLEGYVRTTNLSPEIARRWRDAAVAALSQVSDLALRRCVSDAEGILESIGAADHAWRSGELDSGFEQRLSRFGMALSAHVDSRATAISGELQGVYGSIWEHRLGRQKGRRTDRAEMAIRLARWLADRAAAAAPTSSTLAALARAYSADGGFVDWARQVLRGGEPNKELAAAYVRLVDRVTELRETENLKFGRAVADERAAGDVAAGLVPVEQMLDQVVAKAAAIAPVLLLVVDGMSWAVFRELATDIKSKNWIEVGLSTAPDVSPSRLIGLTALPSVTEVCRTSLFCGTLRRGQAYDEANGFSAHPALTGISQAGYAPKLFHKAALEGDEDTSLAGDIRSALADRKQKVVGIVINAVDDHLDKGDQIDAVWTIPHIRALDPILAEAKAAGRLVILLSDHGHVLDRQTKSRDATDGLRWRRPSGKFERDELEVSSPRVLLPEGGKVVVPWSELLRYGPKKNGYHGGASPQEMLFPISILWAEEKPPAGMGELPGELPPWWTEPTIAPAATTVAASVPAQRPVKEKAVPETLFDVPKPVPAPAPIPAALPASAPQVSEEPWIAALLASDVFAVQRKLAGRARIEDALLRRLLATLSSRGGTMLSAALAAAVDVPEHRLPGLLVSVGRLLNVEGYAILDRQDAANTVVLNVALLKKQFELSP